MRSKEVTCFFSLVDSNETQKSFCVNQTKNSSFPLNVSMHPVDQTTLERKQKFKSYQKTKQQFSYIHNTIINKMVTTTSPYAISTQVCDKKDKLLSLVTSMPHPMLQSNYPIEMDRMEGVRCLIIVTISVHDHDEMDPVDTVTRIQPFPTF